MKIRLIFLIAIFFVYIPEAFSMDINGTADWAGEVIVTEQITVKRNAVLNIAPETVVKFSPDTGLTIEGILNAAGKYGQKIVFTSINENDSSGKWRGLVLFSSNREGNLPNRLSDCVFKFADIAINCIQGTYFVAENCIFEKNVRGILCSQGSVGIIRNCEFSENAESGIMCQQSEMKIANNRFTGNNNIAVACMTGSNVDIEYNFVEKNRYGIACALSDTVVKIKNNIFQNNEFGIFAERLANLAVSNNTLQNNEYGIYLERGPRPEISMNEITENRTGIFIKENFDLAINNNNIYKNREYNMGLQEVSNDYMKKMKQTAKNKDEIDRSVFPCMREKFDKQEEPSNDYIDATKNFWGEDMTKEMEEKGQSANISKLLDYYDNPFYIVGEEKYKENYILYSNWREKAIIGAGAEKSYYGRIKPEKGAEELPVK